MPKTLHTPSAPRRWSLPWLGFQCLWKLWLLPLRLWHGLRQMPARWRRIGQHLAKGWAHFRQPRARWQDALLGHEARRKGLEWGGLLFFYLLDALLVAELYTITMDWAKFNSRPLHAWEIELARSVFGDSIRYELVCVDEYAFIGPKQQHFAYVSFFIVNSWGQMQNSILVHELVHVWQYQRFGAAYIFRAWQAQRSPMAYNYGGVSALKSLGQQAKAFLAFNFEQQGDIVSDYYLIREGYRPHWGQGRREDLPIYEAYVRQLRQLPEGLLP